LNAIVRQFSNNYSAMFLMVASIAVGITLYNYNNLSLSPMLSTLVYFSHTFLYRDMNQIRAGIAAAFALFLIIQIYERRRLAALGTIAIAGLFHVAAFSLIIPWVASHVRMTKAIALAALALGVALGMVGIGNIIVPLMPDLGFITDRIQSYYSQSQHSYALGVFDVTNIKNITILSVAIMVWERAEARHSLYPILVMFFSLAVFWRLAFNDFAIIAARVATFFAIVEPVLVVTIALVLFRRNLAILAVSSYALAMLVLNLVVRDTPPYLPVFL